LVLGNTLVYTVKDVAGRGTVWLYNAVTRDKKKLALPEDGSAGSLHANLDGKSFGFLFTASDYRSDNTNTLFTYDLGTSKLTQVVGFDTKPLKALEWQFARNGKTIAALGIDSTLLLVNPGSPPLPLGQYDDVRGFTYDDSSIFVDDIRTGKQAINLRTGERTPLPKLPESSYVLTADPLNIEPGSVLRVQSYKGNESSGQIIVNRPQGKKQIYDAGSDEGYIAFNTLSPNDQYVAIELRSGSTDQTTIKIIDTFTGKVVNTVSGTKARWLNGVQ
jgi:hypothetical protein